MVVPDFLAHGLDTRVLQPLLRRALPASLTHTPHIHEHAYPLYNTLHDPLVLVLLPLLIRLALGPHSFSGHDNAPRFGDFEAQRHWMEVTVNLPVREWYRNSSSNDLDYWGLDYPPLTAYVSCAFGALATHAVPELVELHASRGISTPDAKAFMRLSVVLCDLLVFFPAVAAFCQTYYSRQHSRRAGATFAAARPIAAVPAAAVTLASEIYALALLQPGLVLVDHGHFQYNCVCHGLVVWAVVLIAAGRPFSGSFAFCLALNFKQMALYFAPSFFFFLLSDAWHRQSRWAGRARRVIGLAIVVVATFAVLWAPFLYPDPWDAVQVLRRVFPVQRGLFEDKVANFWCTISLVGIKLRAWASQPVLVLLCLAATVLACVPSCVDLMRRPPSVRRLVWSLFNCSLAFFLFSYHVHEKTILLPLVPAALVMGEAPGPVCWFSLLALFSMWPLLWRDGLALAYLGCGLVFLVAAWIAFGEELMVVSVFGRRGLHVFKWDPLPMAALGACIGALQFVGGTERYPDLGTVLIEAVSFVGFFLALVWGNITQWGLPDEGAVVSSSGATGASVAAGAGLHPAMKRKAA